MNKRTECTYLFFQKGEDVLVNVKDTVLFVTTDTNFDIQTVVSQNHYLAVFDGETSKPMLKWYEPIEVTLYKENWTQVYPSYEDGIKMFKNKKLYGYTHRNDVFFFLEDYGQLESPIDPSFVLGENWD